MDKFSIDFDKLNKQVNAPKMYKLADLNPDKVEKLGAGVVRFTDESNKTGLWQIVADDDGNECIVSMYGDNDEVVKNSWTVETDRFKKTATVFYKDTPVKEIPIQEIGIEKKEADKFALYLQERLAESHGMVRALLNDVEKSYKEKIQELYPELKNGV